MYGLDTEDIEAINKVFSKHSEIETAVLYGSRAKGNYRNDSDIDLTLKGEKITLTQLFAIETELDDLLLPNKIDLSIYHKIENPDFIEHIDRVGIVFYEKEENQEWKEYKLKDLGLLQRGRSRHRPRYAFHLYGGKYPFIQTGQIRAASKYITKYEQTYNEDGLKQSKLWPKGTLCVTIAANIAELAILDFDACFPDSVLGFIPNNKIIDLDFIYYTLTHFQRELKHIGEGSVQDNINLGTFEDLLFPVPSLPEQTAIASVLSSLDNKIDLLHRQNETLEAMAETFFKKWFVEEMDEDWEEKPLSFFGEIICGKTPSKKNAAYFNGDIPFIKIPDMHNKIFVFETTDTLSEKGKNSQINKSVPAKSICVSCIATVGLVILSTRESQTNQQINSIIPKKEIYTYYLFLLMRSSYDLLHSMASGGTATLNLNTGNFSKIEIPEPKESLLESFHNKVESLFDKIYTNQSQIQNIEKLRNTLLPKLMSGEIKVMADD